MTPVVSLNFKHLGNAVAKKYPPDGVTSYKMPAAASATNKSDGSTATPEGNKKVDRYLQKLLLLPSPL